MSRNARPSTSNMAENPEKKITQYPILSHIRFTACAARNWLKRTRPSSYSYLIPTYSTLRSPNSLPRRRQFLTLLSSEILNQRRAGVELWGNQNVNSSHWGQRIMKQNAPLLFAINGNETDMTVRLYSSVAYVINISASL